MYGDWARLANISAAIDVLASIKPNVVTLMKASYAGTSHKDVDTSDLVSNKSRELQLNQTKSNRTAKTTVDILVVGEHLRKSSTLATFNKNRRDLLKGIVAEEQEDDIPPLDLVVEAQDDVAESTQ
jgi:hypothetical protein